MDTTTRMMTTAPATHERIKIYCDYADNISTKNEKKFNRNATAARSTTPYDRFIQMYRAGASQQEVDAYNNAQIETIENRMQKWDEHMYAKISRKAKPTANDMMVIELIEELADEREAAADGAN